MRNSIKVYAPNLARRADRRASLLSQFEARTEFQLIIIPALERENGAWGLWQTFYAVVKEERVADTPYFIFCEDDHAFTKNYDYDLLW